MEIKTAAMQKKKLVMIPFSIFINSPFDSSIWAKTQQTGKVEGFFFLNERAASQRETEMEVKSLHRAAARRRDGERARTPVL